MRFFFILMLTLCAFLIHAQDSTAIVTLNGISDIKMFMKKAELEKLLGYKLPLKVLTKKDEETMETIHCSYKGTELDITLFKKYALGKSYGDYEISVFEIESRSPLIKTRSGIGIGDDKCKVINTYDGYRINIDPEYEDENPAIRSKTRSEIWLRADRHTDGINAIVFYLIDNKVARMAVKVYDGDY